jgi:hypothetical protein
MQFLCREFAKALEELQGSKPSDADVEAAWKVVDSNGEYFRILLFWKLIFISRRRKDWPEGIRCMVELEEMNDVLKVYCERIVLSE